ncbi:beta-lactamase domain-containing protein [Metarhizium album ARSEF 1941]|uniref:Beta-lactamase domain-containing protein n=1 Tax=Metarhizium album (strain ARSEF 1941) TaxID=1081103 RepID=A0A0B2WLI7_METAS|nr:beta-lactamase domain-containing protein [Metarhizium album ARSEF 1941]KHN94778.1 beta-lactamase domain-containing protein [Metarhizium album ARSEF 1941]
MSIVQIPNTNKIVIIDCLTSIETANAAFMLYQDHHKERFQREPEIHALLYTHNHVDHFGGAQAIVKLAGDENIRIIGPDGFLEHAVSENSPTGQIGCGLGQGLSRGHSSLVAPNQSIKEDDGVLRPGIVGLEIICQLTPGTEAPAEVNSYFPAYNGFCMAENATHTLHNIQTLRGAPVRDARLWSRYLDESISLFGHKADVVFSSHHWPTWKHDGAGSGIQDDKVETPRILILTFLSEQRDYYAHLHNETLRLLNNGSTPAEISEQIMTPPNLSLRTNLRGYDGSGNLRFAATLLNKIIFADPKNTDAKNELISVYRELGQGAENGTWCNRYLCGAHELQYGPHEAINVMTPSSVMALNLGELFDTMAIRINGPEAFALENAIAINFMVEDMPRKSLPGKGPIGWHLRLSNGAMTGHGIPFVSFKNPRDGGDMKDSKAELTVWLSHGTLVTVVGTAAAGHKTEIKTYQVVTLGDPGQGHCLYPKA